MVPVYERVSVLAESVTKAARTGSGAATCGALSLLQPARLAAKAIIAAAASTARARCAPLDVHIAVALISDPMPMPDQSRPALDKLARLT